MEQYIFNEEHTLMKRRDFIKAAAATGISSVLSQRYSSPGKAMQSSAPGFDLHPFIRNHPEAVFIHLTAIESKTDAAPIHDVGYKLAKELIVPVNSGGFPNSTKITMKPNWTCATPKDGKPIIEKLGMNTDPNFIEGWVKGMKESGPQSYYIRECACPNQWKDMGWADMCERNGIDLRDLSSKDFWDLEAGKDINFVKVPQGVVFKEVGYMAPMNEPETFLINVGKMKSHAMGLSAGIKNLQGICGRRFSSFCNPHNQIRKDYDERYHKYFQDDFEAHIEELYARHVKEGIPRWDRPGEAGGIWVEEWSQRMLDSLSVTPIELNIVEGIYCQDGNGFGFGPYEKLGPAGVTSRDYMSNMILFGKDPFLVDMITFWLGGHEPGNFGLFHLAIERGMSKVLDPHDIPIYLWKDGQATLTTLDNLKRTPLVTYYLRRDYHGQNEPAAHLCDEPFDYSAWKEGKRVGDCSPSIRQLGYDSDKNLIGELSLPQKEDICVEVLNKNGDVVWRLRADDLEPGVHQVVWDGFDKHGMHTVYVKGMGWDAERQMVTFS